MTQTSLFDDVTLEICERIGIAFIGGSLSPVESAVLKQLQESFGREKIRSTDSMQATWVAMGWKSWDRRAVRAAVKTLIEQYNIPIGSSRTPGANGYWLIVTDEEADEAVRHLRNEIFSLWDRIKVLSPKSSFVRQLQGQIELLKEQSNAGNEALPVPHGVRPSVSPLHPHQQSAEAGR